MKTGFVLSAMLLCFGPSLGATEPATLSIDVQRLSPRVAVFYGGPWDNGIVAVATRKGLVVVDAPFSPSIARSFREAIQTEFQRKDFLCLINTHEHECHIGGNGAFADLPILGHASLPREMLKDPDWATRLRGVGEREVARVRERLLKLAPKRLESPEWAAYERSWRIIQDDLRDHPVRVLPTVTFDRELTVHAGDVSVRLDHYGHSHGVGDTIVSLPEENLILTAGIFYPTHVPSVDKVIEGATPQTIDNWFTVMHRLLGAADEHTRFLASHGRAVMKKGQYQGFVAYLETLWSGVRRARADGRSLDQARAELQLKDFPEIAKLPNEQLRGTEWENLDIHRQNIELLWKVLDGRPYLGEELPGCVPRVFAPGVVSKGNVHSRLLVSPDGRELIWNTFNRADFSTRMLSVRNDLGTWTDPRPPFAATGSTQAEVFAPGGGMLHYREQAGTGWVQKRVERTATGWGPSLAAVTPFDASFSFTLAGQAYFSARLEGKAWNTGIHSARATADGLSRRQPLAPVINVQGGIDYTPFIAPDESFLLFSSNRPEAGDREDMHLHVSFRTGSGTWTVPRRMFDLPARFPSLSPDGKLLFFCGDDGDVYWVDAAVIQSFRPAPPDRP